MYHGRLVEWRDERKRSGAGNLGVRVDNARLWYFLKRDPGVTGRPALHKPLKNKRLSTGTRIALNDGEPVCKGFVPMDTGLQEDCMKLKSLGLGVLALSLFAIPAAAQKSHSNKGGAARADNRADAVQAANKKDKDHDPFLTTTRARASTRARPRANTRPKVTATEKQPVRKQLFGARGAAATQWGSPFLFLESRWVRDEQRVRGWIFR